VDIQGGRDDGVPYSTIEERGPTQLQRKKAEFGELFVEFEGGVILAQLPRRLAKKITASLQSEWLSYHSQAGIRWREIGHKWF